VERAIAFLVPRLGFCAVGKEQFSDTAVASLGTDMKRRTAIRLEGMVGTVILGVGVRRLFEKMMGGVCEAAGASPVKECGEVKVFYFFAEPVEKVGKEEVEAGINTG